MDKVWNYLTVARWVAELGQLDAAHHWLYKALVTCQALPDDAYTMAARGKITRTMWRIQ